MPIFPGPVKHNNPNAPIVKLDENQIKGAGIFANISARNLLASSVRVIGYTAYVTSENKLYVYRGADIEDTTWELVTNWAVAGGSDSYEHTDNLYGGSQGASAQWTVNHNLNRYPSVDVVETIGSDNTTGEKLEGFSVVYNDANTLIISFKAGGADIAVQGRAYIN
jgi:hypothetical protein